MAYDLNTALKEFEATEANLVKLERLWKDIEGLIPQGLAFSDGSSPDDIKYESLARDFENILKYLPAIDGYKLAYHILTLNEIGQARFDCHELGEQTAFATTEESIFQQGKRLREYRRRFDAKRREFIRNPLSAVMDSVDETLRAFDNIGSGETPAVLWEKLARQVAEIHTLLAGSPRPPRWTELNRHLHFGGDVELNDIRQFDWPSVKSGLEKILYADNDPIPTRSEDLGQLVAAHPKGPIATQLCWSRLNPEEFERLIFTLISTTDGYENPQWLTHTNAPDRGRDLSVMRVINDPLCGSRTSRVIIQCRLKSGSSIGMSDIAVLKEQMSLWEPPRVDELVIATTGRFTTDAVDWVERNNREVNQTLRIEMWPESHLERLLALRPSLIADFRLRS